MNDFTRIALVNAELQLLIIEGKIKACESSSVTIRRLHIDMLKAEQLVWKQFITMFKK